MKNVLRGILICSLLVGGLLQAKEKRILAGGTLVAVSEKTGGKNTKSDEKLYEEFLEWLNSQKAHLKSYRTDSSKACSFLREARTQASIFRDVNKVSSKCIAMVSQFLYAEDIEVQTEAVKTLAVFKGNQKVLQLLSQKLSRLSGKLRAFENLQIETINAVAGLAPYEQRASSALLVVVKRDFQATDKVKLAVLCAWGNMPNIGTVDTMIEAYALMAPCPDYLDGKPPTSCDPPDQAKYMSWLQTKETFYSTFRSLIEPDFNGNLGRSHWKRWIDKNRKGIMQNFQRLENKDKSGK